MGATFSQPTYFYESDAKPDLVDTNGPIYSRTPVVRGIIIPTAMDFVVRMLSDAGVTKESHTQAVSHNLSCIEKRASSMSSASSFSLITAGLSGYVEFDKSNVITVTDDYCSVDIEMTTESFTFNGTKGSGYPVTGTAMLCSENDSPTSWNKPYIPIAAGNWLFMANTVSEIHINFPLVRVLPLKNASFICF